MKSSLISLISILIINGSILYYLKQLNKENCNCTIDWRYQYLTVYAVALMTLNVIIFFYKPDFNCSSTATLYTLLFLGNIIYFYALYTYIEQLDKEKCLCAIEKNPTLHTILYYYRYVFFLYVILSILLIFKAFKMASCIKYVMESNAKGKKSGKGKKSLRTKK